MTLRIFFLSICMVAFAMTAKAQNPSLIQEHTPTEIKTFVETHFPKGQITKYKKKVNLSRVKHEVKLNDKTELEFDQDFELTEAEAKFHLPESIIPQKIVQYIQSNYSGAKIEEWEKKSYGQKVELTSGLDLYFDHQGDFMKAD